MFCTFSTAFVRPPQLKNNNKKAIMSRSNVDALGNAETKTRWRIAHMSIAGRIAPKSSIIYKKETEAIYPIALLMLMKKILKFHISRAAVTSPGYKRN